MAKETIISVDPTTIEVDPTLRGRSKPLGDDVIAARAESIRLHGQLTPVECRKVGKKLLLTYGYTRHAAALLLHKEDTNFRLRVSVVECDDKQAFMRNLIENAARSDTSPIDDMHNYEILRTKHGYKDADICRELGVQPARVSRLKKFGKLTEEQQNFVHTGQLTFTAACDLLEIPEDKREAALQFAWDDERREYHTGRLRDFLRMLTPATAPEATDEQGDKGEGDGEGEKEEPKVKPRTLKQVRSWFEECTTAEDVPDDVKKFCTAVLKFVDGGPEKSLDKAFEKICQLAEKQ